MTPATLRSLLDTVRRAPGIPVIMGPTAAGKSELAFALARECGVATPLMEETDAILSGRKKPADAVLSLMRRDPRAERD